MRSEFCQQGLTNTAWAFSLLRCEDFPLLDAIAESAIKNLRESSPTVFAGIAWAFAALCFGDGPLLHSTSPRAINTLPAHHIEYGSQHQSSTAWAFAALNLKNIPLL